MWRGKKKQKNVRPGHHERHTEVRGELALLMRLAQWSTPSSLIPLTRGVGVYLESGRREGHREEREAGGGGTDGHCERLHMSSGHRY